MLGSISKDFVMVLAIRGYSILEDNRSHMLCVIKVRGITSRHLAVDT